MNSPYKGKFKVTQQFKGNIHDGLDLVGLDSKNIYSTVDGVVERAGWENIFNKKQGFGRYVRIKKSNSVDRYYFGHLSALKVKKGQSVKKGDLIGIEGNTGYSFGSHCHYCIRGNASKQLIRDVSEISGIPNKLRTYDDGYESQKKAKKSNEEIAREVLQGKWGNGVTRKQKLKKAGYNPATIQKIVNKMLKG